MMICRVDECAGLKAMVDETWMVSSEKWCRAVRSKERKRAWPVYIRLTAGLFRSTT